MSSLKKVRPLLKRNKRANHGSKPARGKPDSHFKRSR